MDKSARVLIAYNNEKFCGESSLTIELYTNGIGGVNS